MNLVMLAQASPATGTNAPAASWNFGRLLELRVEGGELVFTLGPLVLLIIALIALLTWLLYRKRKLLPDYDVVEAELDIAKLGSVKIKPNHENIQIAHEAWVELTTRKAALPFDEENDVITEVYDSYYQLFSHLRDLTKAIPAQKLRRCPDTKELVRVMVKVLNEGLRPHLTRWQARFRKWYDGAAKDPANATKSPQEIQRQFHDYSKLVEDLKRVQGDLVKYGEFLRQVAQGKEE